MFNFKAVKHKYFLTNIFSHCFEPMRDELGNVPIKMQTSPQITASIIGVCRAYALNRNIQESTFDLIVDAVFEELFRRESIEVQTRTETWLHNADKDFMTAYYQAKTRAIQSLNLDWLSDYAKQHFKVGHHVMYGM